MIRTIVLLASAAVCAGCVGSVLESNRAEPEVFRLTAPQTADGGGALPYALAVGRPRAPVSLDTERIAIAGPATRFDYYADVRWAEPAPLMLQQLLVQTLAADGRFATVVALPSRVPSDYDLEVELRRFEAQSDGQGPPVVQVAMQVTLLDGKRGARLASFPATASVAAAADRRAEVLSAFDAATQQVISAVVAATRNIALEQKPTPTLPTAARWTRSPSPRTGCRAPSPAALLQLAVARSGHRLADAEVGSAAR